MEKNLSVVFNYFAVFEYFPSFKDVYTFFPKKISKKRLKTAYEAKKYTVGEYSKKISNIKYQISKRKLGNWRFRAYLKLLSLFPQVKLVGLSGSISMMNAKENDDIDLFIITAKNRLFTGRLIALVLAQMLGLRRLRDSGTQFLSHESEKIAFPSSHRDKVCLNLFFDEADLVIPKRKQTLFVGHEVLQMKPIINKSYTYEKFLYANRWVIRFFPNAAEISNFKFLSFDFTQDNLEQSRKIISNQFQISKFKNYKLNKNFKLKIENLSDWLENQLKRFQLKLIRKHQTTELITSNQLWFHPDDFEKKIKLP